MMRVGVIILNWNNGQATTVCIQDVLGLRYSSMVAYVVDNGSSDGSLAIIRKYLESTGRPIVESSFDSRSRTFTEGQTSDADGMPVHLIAIDSNLGYGGGNNVAIALALRHGADAVWVLNNDARPAPDSLHALASIATEDARRGMVGSLVLDDDGTDRVQCIGGSRYDWLASRSRAIGKGSSVASAQSGIHPLPDYIDGCAIFLTRPFILDVGAFEEAYHLYCEEIDLAVRARSHGWRWAVARSAIVRHGFGATSGSSRDRRRRSSSSYYYASRSAMMLVRKQRPTLAPLAAVARCVFAASLAIQGLWTPAKAVLRGVSDGLAARPVGDPSYRAVMTTIKADPG